VGAAVWLAESRCNRQAGCVACVSLRDPRCSWRLDLRECAFAAEPEGLTNASSGHHSGCPISSRDLNSHLGAAAPPWSVWRQPDRLCVTRAAMNSDGVSGVPVGKFVAALIALCLLCFSVGFFLGCFVRRRRNVRRDVGRGGAEGSAAEREKCIGEVPANCHGAAAAAAAGDVPLRLRRSQHGERGHQAVSNEYTEHPPQAVASYATPPAVPAVMRIVSSHSSALDSYQSCSADVPAIDDVDEDEEENSGMHTRRGQPIGDHRDNDWRHI
uniref:PSI domain-containing protein n=1 Tax=Macrostomum lignano TaxID=282301 RepID=A0A1I8J0D8_9PLAT